MSQLKMWLAVRSKSSSLPSKGFTKRNDPLRSTRMPFVGGSCNRSTRNSARLGKDVRAGMSRLPPFCLAGRRNSFQYTRGLRYDALPLLGLGVLADDAKMGAAVNVMAGWCANDRTFETISYVELTAPSSPGCISCSVVRSSFERT